MIGLYDKFKDIENFITIPSFLQKVLLTSYQQKILKDKPVVGMDGGGNRYSGLE